MKNLMVLLCLALMSSQVLSQTILHPSQYPSVAKFSHISCSSFSDIDKAILPEIIAENNIAFEALGFGNFNEGTLSAKYGNKNACQFIMKYVTVNGTTQTEYIDSINTDASACLTGRIMLDSILAGGFKFIQSLTDHTKISLELTQDGETLCNGGPLYLEFTRQK